MYEFLKQKDSKSKSLVEWSKSFVEWIDNIGAPDVIEEFEEDLTLPKD